MKYTILINQLKWQEYFPEADFRHAIVLEIIKSLCNSQSDKIMRSSDGYTWISNNLIIKEAPMLQYKSKAGLSPILNKLSKWELIKIRKDKSNNNYYKITEKAEMLDRKIEVDEHPLEIANGGVSDCKRPRKESLTYNTTINQTTNINNNGYPEKIKEIISYLNQKAETNYKTTTNQNIKLITARLNEGFTIEDFKKVIDNKIDDWAEDDKYCKYLRPLTLFGNKFESYLNQKNSSDPYDNFYTS